MLPIIVKLGLYTLAALIGIVIAWRFSKRKWIWAVAGLMGLVCAYLFVLWVGAQPPSYVAVNLSSPKPGVEVVGFQVTVEGDVNPQWARIYVLVHPSKTDQWYVQNLPSLRRVESPDKPALWTNITYLGTTDLGVNESYDIIALASSDLEIIDLLRGRSLQPGDAIQILPVMNQSQVVTVKRVK